MKRVPGFILTLAVFLLTTDSVSSQFVIKREMRAIWVATVNNVDWPSTPGLTVDDQQRELRSLLDLFVDYNLNTVIFQIRPAADAFFRSSIEPWSQWLNGKQGQGPDPYYDPLDFAIAECRKRGMDFHAWLNPYRAVTDTSNLTDSEHITRTHPEWFLVYGKTVYFDPGLQAVRDYVAGIVGDIVRRYDIDAIHMDDYFYPYRIAGLAFPDDSSFANYPRGYSPDKKDDWRRNNVDLIIKQISDTIKSVKPWVGFGISPFGVWRNADADPSGSATKAGQTNYDDLFADILLWQKEEWIDYVAPQIYWHIGKEAADYSILADWWSRNTYGCRLYIGQAPYRINRKSPDKEWHHSNEIIKQLKLNRTYPNISGSIFFSAKVLKQNPLNLKEKLLRYDYRRPALPPANSRIKTIVPDRPINPQIAFSSDLMRLSWGKGNLTKNFIIYKFRKGKPASTEDASSILTVTAETSIEMPVSGKNYSKKYIYMITSQSYTNTESEPVYFSVSPAQVAYFPNQ